MSRSLKATILCLLIGATLTGCSNSFNSSSNIYSELQENSLSYYKDAEESYNKQVEVAKNYEMNAVLNVAGTYSWNALGEGDDVSTDSVSPKGTYSRSSLEKALGVSKSDVDNKINTYNSSRKDATDGVETLSLSLQEKVVHANIETNYYLETDTNSSLLKKAISASSKGSDSRLIQVVTVTDSNLSVEQCIVWDAGKIVDYKIQSNIK